MLIRAALAAVLSLALAACSVNPATGRTQFDALSRSQEIEIGEEAAPQLISEFGGLVPSERVQAYVSEVGQRIVPHTEADNPELPWEFHVVDSDVINAFAVPGGKVFVSRGMAAAMDNEAQLAAVLAHEVAHITARHVNQRFSQQMGVGIGGAILGGVLGGGGATGQLIGVATELGGQLVLLSFSREQEIEADYLGMRYMARAGYSPIGMRQMMEILLNEAQGRGGIQFFSTHPNPDTRITEIDRRMASEFPHTVNNPQFRLEPERYRQNMLGELQRLPAASQRASGIGGNIPVFALADPTTWCLHCAAGHH